jgi:plasmid maintenance system antidote protein VapI
MNLQLRYDLYETERPEKEALEEIEPLHQVG